MTPPARSLLLACALAAAASGQRTPDADARDFVIALWKAGYDDLAREQLVSERAAATSEDYVLKLDILSSQMSAHLALKSPTTAVCRDLLVQAGASFGEIAKAHPNSDAGHTALATSAALRCAAAEMLVAEDPVAAEAILDLVGEQIESAPEGPNTPASETVRRLRFLKARGAFVRHQATARRAKSDVFRAPARHALDEFGNDPPLSPPLLTLEAWRLEAMLFEEAKETAEALEYLTAACDQLRADLPNILADEARRIWAAGVFLQHARLQAMAPSSEGDGVPKALHDLEKDGLFRGVAEFDLLTAEIEAKAGNDAAALVKAARAARMAVSTGRRAAEFVFTIIARTKELERLPAEVLDAAGHVALGRDGAEAGALAIRLSDAVIASRGAAPQLIAAAHYRKGICLWRQTDRVAAAAAFGASYRSLTERDASPIRPAARRAWLAALRELAKEAPDDDARQSAYRAACTLAGEPPR